MNKWDAALAETKKPKEAAKPDSAPPLPDNYRKGSYVLLHMDVNVLNEIDTIVGELKRLHRDQLFVLTREQELEARRIAALKGAPAANEWIQSLQKKGKPPNRTSFANYLLELGLAEYKRKEG